MRTRRILLLGLPALLVLLVGAVWIVPGLLDWNRYRFAVEALASTTLGRHVTIEGPISLSLLPQPTLTAAGMDVADAGDGIKLTVKELRLRVALIPLLSGRVDARELVLRGPDLRLPWPVPGAVLTARPPAWLESLAARVEGGSISVGGLRASGIDADLGTQEAGALSASGTGSLDGRRWSFSMRLGRAGTDGVATLDATLAGLDAMAGTAAGLSGRLAADGALAARVSVRGQDLSRFLRAPALPFRADGELAAKAGVARIDDLNVEVAGAPAHGGLALRLGADPRLDVSLSAGRLDLDRWTPLLLGGTPAGLPVGLDLSADAATFAGGLLRGVHLSIEALGETVRLGDARAVLPGEAKLDVSGLLSRADPARPAFTGAATLDAPALRTTLHWLAAGGLLPALPLPLDVLRSARLTAHIDAGPSRIALTTLTGTLDGARTSGSLTLRPPARAGGRPMLGVGLTLDRLALDPWLPDPWPGLAEAAKRLAGLDADLRIQAKRASLRGRALGDLSLDAAIEGGRLTLRQLDTMLGGAHLTASGVLDTDGSVREGRLDLAGSQAESVIGELPPGLFGRYGPALRPLWRGPFALQLLGNGPPGALGLRARLDLAGARVEADPRINLATGGWSGPVTLRHPSAAALMRLLGQPELGAWLGEGSFSLVAQLGVAHRRVEAPSFSLVAGGLRAAGALTLARTAEGPKLAGTVRAETLPLPAPPAGAPLPFAALRGWQADVGITARQVLEGVQPVAADVTGRLSLARGAMTLDGFSARLGGGVLTGTARLDAAADPPALALDATLRDATVDPPFPAGSALALLDGQIEGRANLTATGYSPAALLATLAGKVHLIAVNGTLAGFDLAQLTEAVDAHDAPGVTRPKLEAAVRGALGGGSSPFASFDISADVTHGVASLTGGELAASGGSGSFEGSVDLAGGALDLHALLRPAVTDPPLLGLRLTGPAASPRRVVEVAGLAMWLAR